MKRSRRVVLKFMGTAAATSLTGTLALARDCDPNRPGILFPGTMTNTACNSRGGFGASPHGFTEHAVPHEHAGG